MGYVKVDDIWTATNGGLNIIKSYYPDADDRKAFKIRDEKTASSSLKKYNGIWFVTDFGSEAKGKNAIDIVQEEEGVDFHGALVYINSRFLNGAVSGDGPSANRPIVEEVENTTGETILEFNKGVSDHELSFIGKHVTKEIADRYHLRSLKYYITKSGKKISATDNYPIFCIDEGSFQKVYQPKADKEYRFFHVGTRPQDYIFGLAQLKEEAEKARKEAEAAIKNSNEGQEIKPEELEELISKEIEKSLPDVMLCSGDRDAMNVASAGYAVIWKNSETASLSREQYNDIRSAAKCIYNVPDLDETGIREAYKLALDYTDIRTIWLPEILKTYNDWRGNPCKDSTDFFDKFTMAKEMFVKLKNTAMTMRFWDKDKKTGYVINNMAFYQFLQANGYWRIEDKNNKFGYAYIKLEGKIVQKINPDGKPNVKNHVKDFVNRYMENNILPIELRNMFAKTRQTDENILSSLKFNDKLDFRTYGKDYQYIFFKDRAWKITSTEVIEMPLGRIDKNVWDTDIKTRCGHVRKTKKPLFEISYSEQYIKFAEKASYKEKEKYPDIDKYDIKINDDDFIFMKYLVNTSRMYWKKQKDGHQLTEAEMKEQRLHLINKIYSVGYLAHRYKNPSRPWAVFAVDGRESELGKSFGGSGKSILYSGLDYINCQFYIGGRDPRKFKNDFLFDGVDEYTDNVFVDDANQYLDFGLFYPMITGKMNVNPKNAKPFTLSFDESPKFVFTSNFAIKNIDPSTERRILYTVFSDYYHKKDQDGYYLDTLDPEKEFGKNLYIDFTEEEWNLYYNFIALAIQTYLRFEKIDPPMDNVTKRNLRSSIGEDVFAWMNDFFADTNNLNCELLKEDIFKRCFETLPANKRSFMSTRKFKSALMMYCQYRGWIFNPELACNDDQGRIMKSIDGKVQEVFYVQTSTDNTINVKHEAVDDAEIVLLRPTDDIPF